MRPVTIDLNLITLDTGAHKTREDGVCLLEAVAWLAGEPHTDNPTCASPILGAYGRSLNDVLPDDKRQELKPYAPLMLGTAGDGHDETRGYLALDWLIRTYTPAWLDVAGLATEAQALRGLRRIVDMSAARSAGPVVSEARVKATAAWDAARAAAWDAAWDAARDAARDAAWDAAWDAARAAAWDAARDAAGDAARAALAPTTNILQDSAIQLLQAMVNPTQNGRDQ